jgi:hypothetical protein
MSLKPSSLKVGDEVVIRDKGVHFAIVYKISKTGQITTINPMTRDQQSIRRFTKDGIEINPRIPGSALQDAPEYREELRNKGNIKTAARSIEAVKIKNVLYIKEHFEGYIKELERLLAIAKDAVNNCE